MHNASLRGDKDLKSKTMKRNWDYLITKIKIVCGNTKMN